MHRMYAPVSGRNFVESRGFCGPATRMPADHAGIRTSMGCIWAAEEREACKLMKIKERETGIEPAASSLRSWTSMRSSLQTLFCQLLVLGRLFDFVDNHHRHACSRLLHILLIPGTSSVKHLQANLNAATLHIPSEMIADLDSIGAVLRRDFEDERETTNCLSHLSADRNMKSA